MLGETLLALTALAGQTVVDAAATDVWQKAERRYAQLLGHGDVAQTHLVEQWLEETHEQLAGQAGADMTLIRAALAGRWAGRWADLLEENPAAEPELRALVQEIQAALPAGTVSAADHAVAAGRDVNISAASGGVAAGVIHGNVTPPDPTLRGPAST